VQSDHNPDVISDEVCTQFQQVWTDINEGNIDVDALLQ
jgi:hypothetical protein